MAITAYEGDKPYIFISYSHKDGELVKKVIEALQTKGFRVWFDGGIEAGSEWPEYIASHLRGCACLLAFISPSFVESRNCRRELNFAQDLNKDLLDVYIEDVELSDGMRMQLGLNQALWKKNYASWDSFVDALCNARIIQNCRELPATEAPKAEAPRAEAPVQEVKTPVAQDVQRELDAMEEMLGNNGGTKSAEVNKYPFGSKEWFVQKKNKLIGYGIVCLILMLLFGIVQTLISVALLVAVYCILAKSPDSSEYILGKESGLKKKHLKIIGWIVAILVLIL